MQFLFLSIIEEIYLLALCVKSNTLQWVEDNTSDDGYRCLGTTPGYSEFRPHTIEAEHSNYARLLNTHALDLGLDGRYVQCGYSPCQKWLFLSYGDQDRGTHRYFTDVYGCGPCEAKAYDEEFGGGWDDESSDDWYSLRDPAFFS